MKPGQKLDALVAEKVMGWVFREEVPWPEYRAPGDPTTFWYASPVSGMLYRIPPNGKVKPDDFAPSRSIAAAWQVVEKMREQSYTFLIDTAAQTVSVCHESWVTGDPYRSRALPTARGAIPHAICTVALEAVAAD